MSLYIPPNPCMPKIEEAWKCLKIANHEHLNKFLVDMKLTFIHFIGEFYIRVQSQAKQHRFKEFVCNEMTSKEELLNKVKLMSGELWLQSGYCVDLERGNVSGVEFQIQFTVASRDKYLETPKLKYVITNLGNIV